MRIKTKLGGALGGAALLMAFSAQEAGAFPLSPGTAITPTPGVIPSSALLDTVVSPFLITGEIAGTVTTRVYDVDPITNPSGLTFTYDIHITAATGTHTLQNLGLNGWVSFASDATQTGVGVPADNANRDPDPNSDGIKFNFNAPGSPSILGSPGFLDSATLILQSDANSFTETSYGVLSVLTVNGTSLGPRNLKGPPPPGLPDGSLTVALLGIGILGLGVFRKTVSA